MSDLYFVITKAKTTNKYSLKLGEVSSSQRTKERVCIKDKMKMCEFRSKGGNN